MRIIFTFILLNLTIISLSQENKIRWKSEFDFGDDFLMTTVLKIDKNKNQYTITSPQNADIRLFGYFKAKLARLMGKSPKKGVFINIKADKRKDSLIGFSENPMFERLKFKGVLKNNTLNGELIKNDTLVVGTLKAIKGNINNIDYSYLYSKVIEITKNNIYSKKVLDTKEWAKFQTKVKRLFNKAKDDIELFFGFNLLSAKLPFSHYNLIIKTNDEKNKIHEMDDKQQSVIFELKSNHTAYLKIKNFSTSQKELADILPKIVKENYQNLIIDLRNNEGGGIEAAFELAKYIINDYTEIGYFITHKMECSGFNFNQFQTLPKVKPQTTEEFIENLKKEKGAKLIFQKIGNKQYLGNLYVLTNHKTASTCEPITYVLKKKKRATIIGETTAGAMLSAALFEVSGKYKLFLPIADFYTYDGVRLEGIGVTPNIKVPSNKALDKALEIININE